MGRNENEKCDTQKGHDDDSSDNDLLDKPLEIEIRLLSIVLTDHHHLVCNVPRL